MSIPQSGGGLVEHYDQLVQYLSDGCKPRSDWKVGTEHEKFGFFKNTLKPIPYNGKGSVKSLLVGLKDNYGWEPVFEAGNICLLYTSPSPRDRQKSRMPSSA